MNKDARLQAVINEIEEVAGGRFIVGRQETLAGNVDAVRCDTEGCGYWRHLSEFERATDDELKGLYLKLTKHAEFHNENGE